MLDNSVREPGLSTCVYLDGNMCQNWCGQGSKQHDNKMRCTIQASKIFKSEWQQKFSRKTGFEFLPVPISTTDTVTVTDNYTDKDTVTITDTNTACFQQLKKTFDTFYLIQSLAWMEQIWTRSREVCGSMWSIIKC